MGKNCGLVDTDTFLPTKRNAVKGEERNMTPIIFISHRSEDFEIADMLRDYFVASGISNEYIFCSSLPGNDVQKNIPREVKEKIKGSAVNIVILSREYYESAYCINEAGIIWFQDPDTPVIVIGLPEIEHTNMLGFLNDGYIICRLNNLGDISEIYDIVQKAVGTSHVTLPVATAAGQKLECRYKDYIDKKNANLKTTKELNDKSKTNEIKKLVPPLEQIKELLNNPTNWVEEDSQYYHSMFPQYTIVVENDQDENYFYKKGYRMFYHHLQTDTTAYYGTIKIFCNGTQLFSCQSTDLDGHRMTAPCPKTKYITHRKYGDLSICLKYYVVGSLQYLLLRFFEYHIGNVNGQEAQFATRRLLDVVLLFDEESDVESFSTYVSRHLDSFDEFVSQQKKRYIEDENPKVAEVLAKEIANSQALVKMQEKWHEFRENND